MHLNLGVVIIQNPLSVFLWVQITCNPAFIMRHMERWPDTAFSANFVRLAVLVCVGLSFGI